MKNNPNRNVFPSDIRAAGLCMRGTREWFEQHGLSWDLCVSQGTPQEVLLKIDDPFVQRVIQHIRGENGRRGQ